MKNGNRKNTSAKCRNKYYLLSAALRSDTNFKNAVTFFKLSSFTNAATFVNQSP